MGQAPRFFQARLKCKWANQNINKLHFIWNEFLKTDFCQIVVKSDPAGGDILCMDSTKPIPGEVTLILGDAIHNLKASLDYTISEILQWKNMTTTFPMHETREELISSFRTENEIVGKRTLKKGGNAIIERAAPGIGDFIINTIKPYKAEGNFLWALNKLDVRDKHRLLITVAYVQHISGINAADKNNNVLTDMMATNNGNGIFTLGFFGAGGLKIHSQGKPTAEIFINEAGVIENQPLFPVLVQMLKAVTKTIDSIEEFLTGIGWQPIH
jgi:hypothetical protein